MGGFIMCIEAYLFIGLLVGIGSLKAVPAFYREMKPHHRALIVLGAVFVWFFIAAGLLIYWLYKVWRTKES